MHKSCLEFILQILDVTEVALQPEEEEGSGVEAPPSSPVRFSASAAARERCAAKCQQENSTVQRR